MNRTRVSYDRREDRRDRRYPLPPLTIVLADAEYTTVNWSLGGFLLAGFTGRAAIGQKLTGTLRVHQGAKDVAFTATVVRTDEPGQIGVQFTDLTDEVVTMLDRAIARRFSRRN